MKVFSGFFKATVVGGLLFMVPLILMVVVLQKGMGLVRRIVVPLAKQFPDHKFLGIGMTTILSVVVIVLLSFLFGLAARTAAGKRVREWLEYTVMGKVPGYALLKGVIQGATGLENEDDARVALVRIEDAWQIGFVVEIHSDGHRTVYMPGVPNPASGTVFYMTEDRIRPLDMKMGEAVKMIRHLGVGSKDLLKGKLHAPSEKIPPAP
jgi:uncharacterized membrane protein